MTQFSGHTEHSRFICDIPCGPRYVGSTDAFKGNYGYYSTIAPKKHTGVSKQDKIYSYVVNIWFMMKKRGMWGAEPECSGKLLSEEMFPLWTEPLQDPRWMRWNKNKALLKQGALGAQPSPPPAPPSQPMDWRGQLWAAVKRFNPEATENRIPLTLPDSLIRSPFKYVSCTSAKLLSSRLYFQTLWEVKSFLCYKPL